MLPPRGTMARIFLRIYARHSCLTGRHPVSRSSPRLHKTSRCASREDPMQLTHFIAIDPLPSRIVAAG